MDGLEWSFDFGTGTIFDIFHRTGKHPDWIERLKSLVTEGAILEAVVFSVRAETPSGPFDFVVSRVSSNHCTYSTEHSSSSGHSCVLSSLSRTEKSSGGRDWLRHSPKMNLACRLSQHYWRLLIRFQIAQVGRKVSLSNV